MDFVCPHKRIVRPQDAIKYVNKHNILKYCLHVCERKTKKYVNEMTSLSIDCDLTVKV